MKMRLHRACILSALCAALAACASGPKLSTVQIPNVPPDQGRVYFYRTALLGTAVQPAIVLNGQKVGDCQPGGVFYEDIRPGDYEASVATEVERKVTFTMAGGEEKFVRCYITMGLFVGHGNLELVAPEEARGNIHDLSFVAGGKMQ